MSRVRRFTSLAALKWWLTWESATSSLVAATNPFKQTPMEGNEMSKNKIFRSGVTDEPEVEGLEIETAVAEEASVIVDTPTQAEQKASDPVCSYEDLGKAIFDALVHGGKVDSRKVRIDVLNERQVRVVEQPDGGKAFCRGVFQLV